MAFALVVAACGDDDDAETTTTAAATTAAPTTTEAATTTTEAATTTAEETTTTAAEETTTTEGEPEILFDVGVTEEPCPDAVNPDNGCIYLGAISDFSGPFAGFGGPLLWGKQDFWARVNANGGVGGMFDVAITAEHTIDAGYVAEQHVAGYEQIRGSVAALAESLGTLQTLAAVPLMIEDSMVSPVSTWYSGWSFPEVDGGLILEAGTNYCMEAMNGFDFVVQAMEGTEWTYAIVKFPGDYGGDYAAGVKIAAAAYGMGDPLFEIEQLPFSVGGTIDEAVAGILGVQPDVIFATVAPTELANLIGGLAGQGFVTPMYIVTAPGWHPALLAQEALLPILTQAVFQTSYLSGWPGEAEGHDAMRAAWDANRSDQIPNLGYVAGWVMSYNMLALFEQAIANGDLTRAGIAAAAGQLDAVDYEGMLPARSFVGTPDETVERGAVVHRIDPESPDGTAVATPFFVGPTAAEYEFTEPCLVLGE
jgi:hypothetical protein